ncbi:hypothetical protein TEA_008139 [Camellia sinensis var. sinensis]|uniref:Uncharacterized protein n=1 Tax=Camellia sinensis var. sinensis TaxID=542762 RepID=A0A4S4D4F4_CAMSN|nr:hypothetical protein TEA_008139 [Camellia sinensis var. sinensis]
MFAKPPIYMQVGRVGRFERTNRPRHTPERLQKAASGNRDDRLSTCPTHNLPMLEIRSSGPSLGALIAGGAAAAAAAYGAHQLSQGAHNLTHGGFYGRQGKFKRGKHGRFGKRGGKYRKWK